MYIVKFSKQAEKDKKLLKGAGLEHKARELLNIIINDPFQTPPPYEELVGNLDGFISRRINLQQRLVYEVIRVPFEENETRYEGIVKVLRMWTHYDKLK